MSNRLQVEYRGHNIVFETMSERWTVDTPHGSYSHMDIGQVKKFCDKAQKSKINGLIVIKSGGVYASGIGFNAVKVTSVTPEGEIWISHVKGGRREKLWKGDSLIKNSAKNKVVIKQIVELKGQIEKLRDLTFKLEEQLEKIDLFKMLGEEK